MIDPEPWEDLVIALVSAIVLAVIMIWGML
jgi:hypothetical protein